MLKYWTGPVTAVAYVTDEEILTLTKKLQRSENIQNRNNIVYHIVYKRHVRNLHRHINTRTHNDNWFCNVPSILVSLSCFNYYLKSLSWLAATVPDKLREKRSIEEHTHGLFDIRWRRFSTQQESVQILETVHHEQSSWQRGKLVNAWKCGPPLTIGRLESC